VAYSIANIVNLALDEIGVPAIAVMTEKTDAAIMANRIWEYARDEVLEDGDWNFAKTTAQLVQDAVYKAAPTDPKWDYRYTKPTSCLKVRSLVDSNDINISKYIYNLNTQGWAVETDYIYCGFDNTADALYCRYTTIITDPTKFSAKFIRAIKYKLAGMMARKLAAKDPEPFEQKYVMALTEATGQNQKQDWVDGEEGNTDWVNR
jgi:hypothetical protein